ncbi:MAG TPA: PQQ-binding-like beta-propeller repeat protein [Vicinamibacterales bacterium]|nr:PQQ-binding-like beta-propeller repeat protein [Vicinamibacterales bacterium]
MRRLLRILKKAAILVAALAITGAVLYQFFGLRVVIYGGGSPHLAFVTPASAQAEAIERHRQAQATAVPGATVPTAPAATPAPSPATAGAVPDPVTTLSPIWSDFRGANRDGHYTERPILIDWPNGQLKPLWKQPVGGGYASFVTARIGSLDLGFTIEQRGNQEVVAAYDVATGREQWTSKWPAEFKEFMGGDGPRATPTYFDGYVYALGGLGELRALEAATGRTIWRTNILTDAGAANLQWGMAASPLIVDNSVVVLPGGSAGKSVAAYNHRTGARVWSALDDRQAYVSPMLVTIDGVRQLLIVSATRMMGLTPTDGTLLWEFPWTNMSEVNAGQPVVIGKNRVFISSAYDKGAAVIEVTMKGTRGTVREVWQNNRMKNQFSSSVLHEGYIYGLDESILACLDAGTGELKWKGGRYGYGQIALASGHIIVLTEDGDLALVRATPEKHVELARFTVLDGKTWNHPAFSNGLLLVRNLKEMAAFDLRR